MRRNGELSGVNVLAENAGNDTIDGYGGDHCNCEINKVLLHGITAEEVSYTTNETGPLIIQLGQNDSIKLIAGLKVLAIRSINLVFEDGSIISSAQMSSFAIVEATTRDDTISGGLGNDMINGAEGSDTYRWAMVKMR